MNKKPTIDFITLGCSKNLVDSETLMGLFESHGYQVTHDSENPQGEIAVINTCGFIEDAKQESIDTILEFAQAKTEGKLQKLYVMGCLSERYLADLEKEIPEVDGWYGKFNYKQIILKTLIILIIPIILLPATLLLPAITPISKSVKVVTAIVPIALFLSLPADIVVVRWKRY